MSDCKHCRERRDFLKLGGLTVAISAIDPTLLRASPRLRLAQHPNLRPTGKTLVHIWLRGGQDGLNVSVPTEAGEYAIYQSYRPGLQIPMAQLTPQQLTPDFALHPATNAGLYALWQQGMVAALPTVGYPVSSRSHFDGQKFLENGTPWDKTTPDGWLTRWLTGTGPSADPLRAVSFTNSVPLLLSGPSGALSFNSIADLRVSRDPTRNQKYLDNQQQWYALPTLGRTYDDDVAGAGTGLVTAIEEIELRQPLPPPAATYPGGSFGTALSELAQLMKVGFAVEVANLELNGWDHHAQQENAFDNLLTQLSDGIAAFVADIGPALMANTLVVTISEFGRTARENGNAGTDHGNAWTSFAVGPMVNQGVWMGAAGWPGLANLRDNRDLGYTVDFRDFYSEILDRHMGILTPDVFPGWTYTPVGFL